MDLIMAIAIVSILVAISLPILIHVSPAWTHDKPSWSVGDEADFRRFVETDWNKYLGKTIDCADLAITLLIDFASAHKLPVVLRSTVKTFDSRESVTSFAFFGAKDTPATRNRRIEGLTPLVMENRFLLKRRKSKVNHCSRIEPATT